MGTEGRAHVEPVRSRSASSADGRRRSTLRVRAPCGSAVVGCGADRGNRNPRRFRDRSRFRQRRTGHHICSLLRTGMHRRCTARPAVQHLHRRSPAAAAVVRRGSVGLFHTARSNVRWIQGHCDQLRVPADRTLPSDAVHLGRRTADRDDPLVPGHVTQPAIGTCRRHRRGTSHTTRQIRRVVGDAVLGVRAFWRARGSQTAGQTAAWSRSRTCRPAAQPGTQAQRSRAATVTSSSTATRGFR